MDPIETTKQQDQARAAYQLRRKPRAAGFLTRSELMTKLTGQHAPTRVARNSSVDDSPKLPPKIAGFLQCCLDEGLGHDQITDRILKSAQMDPEMNDMWVRFYEQLDF